MKQMWILKDVLVTREPWLLGGFGALLGGYLFLQDSGNGIFKPLVKTLATNFSRCPI